MRTAFVTKGRALDEPIELQAAEVHLHYYSCDSDIILFDCTLIIQFVLLLQAFCNTGLSISQLYCLHYDVMHTSFHKVYLFAIHTH